jgi:hypothetical protein
MGRKEININGKTAIMNYPDGATEDQIMDMAHQLIINASSESKDADNLTSKSLNSVSTKNKSLPDVLNNISESPIGKIFSTLLSPNFGLSNLAGKEIAKGLNIENPSLENVARSPTMSVLAGMSHANPAQRLADVITKGLGVGSTMEETEKANPRTGMGGRIAGEVIAGIPTYMAGIGALKNIPAFNNLLMARTVNIPQAAQSTSRIMNILKGALTNASIGQYNRGAEINPTGSAIDLATGGGGEILSPVISGVGRAEVSGGRNLMRGLFKASKKDEQLAAKVAEYVKGDKEQAFDLIADRAYRRGIWGTKESMKKQSQAVGEKAGETIKSSYQNIAPIKKTDITDPLRVAVTKAKSEFPELASQADELEKKAMEIWNYGGKKGGKLTGEQLLKVRDDMAKIVGEWTKGQPTAIRDAAKNVYNTIGDLVTGKVGKELAEANLDYGFSKGMKKALPGVKAKMLPSGKAMLAGTGAGLLHNPALAVGLMGSSMWLGTPLGRSLTAQMLKLAGMQTQAAAKGIPTLAPGMSEIFNMLNPTGRE